MAGFLQDLRLALRSLHKGGAVVWTAVLSLAVGLAGAAVVFSAVDAVILRPLPFPEPERLVAIRAAFPPMNLPDVSSSPAELQDWGARVHSFSDVGGYAFGDANLTGKGDPERVRVGYATAGLMRVLQVRPVVGRIFEDREDDEAHSNVVILSHRFWRERMDSDPGIVGRSLQLDGLPHTVVGVAPPGVALQEEPQLWSPPRFSPEQRTPSRRGFRFMNPVARLKPGVTLEAAQAELTRLTEELRVEYAEGYPAANGWTVTLRPFQDHLLGRTQGTLWVLLAGAAILLLGACANVANLLLARAAARRRELAVRTALGASQWQLGRALLIDSAILAVVGWALAMVLATWGVEVLAPLLPEGLPRASAIEVGGRTFGILFAVAMVTSIAFGAAPAIEALRSRPHDALKAARALSGKARVRAVLVVAQLALAALLVSGAGVMLRSFQALSEVKPGFDAQDVLTAQVAVSGPGYETPEELNRFFDELVRRAGTISGVDQVSVASAVPMRTHSDWGFRREGRTVLSPGEVSPNAELRQVSAGYFETLRIPLAEGRAFQSTDSAGGAPVVMVNRTLAKRYFADEPVVGQRIRLGGEKSTRPWATIVGVVEDVRELGLDTPPPAMVYVAFPQDPRPATTVVLRSRLATEALTNALRSELRALDPSMPVFGVEPMSAIVWRDAAERRFATLLLGVFAAVAAVLAGVGLFGVMQHAVSARAPEIGLRLALGATSRRIAQLVLGRALQLALAGIAIGAALALTLASTMRALVFGVSERDPWSILATCLALVVLAILSAAAPLIRALRTDPAVTLKGD